ncbi:MAG: hypothetical protein KDE51_16370, partial [Anaerolineales bacterium]|nr:hypothetical protein [Anaerolineales bacterium]
MKKSSFLFLHTAVWVALLLAITHLTPPLHAQEESLSDAQLYITNIDAISAPTIYLRTYGVNPNGLPLNLSTENLVVNHGDQTATDVSVIGQETVGTFTIFLVDTPLGVEDQLPAIQEAILQYASPTFMQEAGVQPIDYVAIYQVGATQAEPLLPPAEYRNTVINFLADPLPTQAGPTALIDSLMGLLNSLDTLKPNQSMFSSIVVFSDGTDAVSTQFQAADVPRTAAVMGIPIYTVTLNNSNLGLSERGTEYMQQVAVGSGGINARLSEPDNISNIWQRISSFRDQNIVQYVIPQITAGDFPIVLSLESNPNVQAGGNVNLAGSRPFVALAIPPESRSLTAPDLSDPLTLKVPLNIGWIDGENREVTQLQLLVNNEVVADLDPTAQEAAEVEIANLTYGANQFQLAMADGNAQRVSSGIVTINVSQGEELVIPQELQTEGSSAVWQFLIGFFIFLVALGAVMWLLYTLRSWPPVQKLGLERFFANLSTRPRRQPQMEPTADGSMATSAIGQPVPPTYQTKRQA